MFGGTRERIIVGRRFLRPLLNQSYGEIINILGRAEGAIGKYLDTERLEALVKRYGIGADEADLTELYTAMTLALWLGRIKMAT